MPEGATNFLCWRVVVRRLYAAYERDAYEAHQAVMPPAAFLEHLQRAFPRAKLSDWRWVDGNWERELDGVQAKRLLEPPAARRQRSFSDRPKK